MQKTKLHNLKVFIIGLTEITLPEKGWFSLWNEYQYKRTRNLWSWNHARRECQSYGADLAVFGKRNLIIRK